MSDAPVPEVTLADLEAARNDGATVVDVREVDEYEAGHVPGAALLPLSELEQRWSEVPADQGTIYVICKSGMRSQKATELLRANGVDAVSVAEGTAGWIDSGRPVVTGSDPG
jgi:rhodanese-related sulfurtransferase